MKSQLNIYKKTMTKSQKKNAKLDFKMGDRKRYLLEAFWGYFQGLGQSGPGEPQDGPSGSGVGLLGVSSGVPGISCGPPRSLFSPLGSFLGSLGSLVGSLWETPPGKGVCSQGLRSLGTFPFRLFL